MSDAISWIILSVLIINLVLLAVLLIRSAKNPSEGLDKALRDELRAGREESSKVSRELREELSSGLKSGNETLSTTLSSLGQLQQTQIEGLTMQLKNLTESIHTSLERARSSLDARVKELQEGNEKKLEEMRKTVDERLQGTLEKRLGESFSLVSERLEAVQRGLGEMQNLATGVGDLKRVLTNVKARGTWAEVQLGAILEQILAPGQYEKNVRTNEGSSESVEYAVRLPGQRNDPETTTWLPIDSKFPQEDYLRLQAASEKGDAEAVQKAIDALTRTIRSSAQTIHDKYLNPPRTTDFAIMFLATEGLYAELLRQPTIVEELQHRYRIVVAGPTTLAAILTSLRMGFQTLAIEKRAHEVWRVLAAVKTEFGKFGEVLDRVKRQLATATNTIDETGIRTRAMEKKLRSMELLPDEVAVKLLDLSPAGMTEPKEEKPAVFDESEEK